MGTGRVRVRALAVCVLVVCAASCGSSATKSTTGQLVACPTDAPSGACSSKGMTCEYPTQSCQCKDGNWSCFACPAAQPDSTTGCPLDVASASVPLACVYGALTCTCEAELGPPKWRCGACPASTPAQGAACGNSSFSCAYRDQTCSCNGGTWGCSPITCPRLNVFSGSCTGVYTCAYPDEDQICACTAAVVSIQCSCPANMPSNGGACGPATCRYGDQSCECLSSGWMCTAACPTARPAAGAACSSDVSCTYPDGICFCSGGIWHC